MSGREADFASDNTAGAHPDVLAAVAAANAGHAASYGDDAWTARAEALIRAELGDRARPFLVWGGTGANVVGLQALLRSHEAVLCAELAHIDVDETGAPEKFLGSKLRTVPAPDGKATPDAVAARITGVGVQHHVQPRVLSLTQSTEYGTAYALDELAALRDLARAQGLKVHLDGARLANAAATLGCGFGDIVEAAAPDALSFGFTKNGALAAEAVVVFDDALAAQLPFIRKQGMQLPSKMRFVAAQVVALLEGGLWRRNASHANALAQRLAAGVRDVAGVTITQRVQANAVFAELPPAWIAPLQERFHFYTWNEARHEVRWMTSWSSTEAEVDALVAAVRELAGR